MKRINLLALCLCLPLLTGCALGDILTQGRSFGEQLVRLETAVDAAADSTEVQNAVAVARETQDEFKTAKTGAIVGGIAYIVLRHFGLDGIAALMGGMGAVRNRRKNGNGDG